MSYVGAPFDYDLFVSYAFAEAETKAPLIRDWSRHNAGHIRELLATALNVECNLSGSEVQVFFDDRVLVSGQPLTQTLREKVQGSALLLVLMSPLYPNKSWCMDEDAEYDFHIEVDGEGNGRYIFGVWAKPKSAK